MRKFLLAFVAVATMTASTSAAVIKPINEPTPIVATTDFKKMSVKEIETMTGKKMNLIQKVGFKIAQKVAPKKVAGGKSQLTALLLALFLGGIGVHRFYLGYTWQGIVQVLFGWNILFPWVIIDIVRIATGALQPKDGEYESTL